MSHLAQDIIAQLDQLLEKNSKHNDNKDRTVRKICEKMLKTLKINLNSFALDVD
jgi:ElaB/YqjD/DUF883 family membrane-anchored ribosome-binding protein